MYERFYGLNGDPFRLSPTGKACFEHETYRRARSYMLYTLQRREGIFLLTGLPGTGKTTLIRQTVRESSDPALLLIDIVASRLDGEDVVPMVAARFGCEAVEASHAAMLKRLEDRLSSLRQQGRHSVLIIDEAQGLSPDALEEVRGLTNLQLDDRPLLQIILVGQPALRDLVRTPELEQLHQRVVAASELVSLNEEDVQPYVEFRLNACGWNDRPSIDHEVYSTVHRQSLGVPRRINLICSRLLLRGMVNELDHLTGRDIDAVVDDLFEEGLLIAEDRSPFADAVHLAL